MDGRGANRKHHEPLTVKPPSIGIRSGGLHHCSSPFDAMWVVTRRRLSRSTNTRRAAYSPPTTWRPREYVRVSVRPREVRVLLRICSTAGAVSFDWCWHQVLLHVTQCVQLNVTLQRKTGLTTDVSLCTRNWFSQLWPGSRTIVYKHTVTMR